ncbi:MAG: TolC family protein, partial [Chlorobiaceae bacterium]|nr:TolC family protein [Chlorobiaceae bacterium]
MADKQRNSGLIGFGRRGQFRVRLLLLITLLLPLPAYATEPLSMRQAYDLALRYDAGYLAAEADTRISKEEVSKAKAAFLPNIKASTSRGRNQTDHMTRFGEEPTVWYNTMSQSLSVRQSLLNLPGIATWKQAKAIKAKSESLFRSEHSSLIVRTAELYCNVLFSGENVAFTDAQVEATKGQLEQSKKRYANGFGTVTEVSEAQASYDLAVADRA